MTPVDAARRAWLEDGILTAHCPACRLYLEAGSGTDHAEAMAAFERAHPEGSHRPHARSAPPGWRLPLSSPGAWSQ